MARKRTEPAARRTRATSRSKASIQLRDNVKTTANDNLSKALADLVPDNFKGTDRYLDVVQWNLEWFGASKSKDFDKKRYALIVDILAALNGDLFIFLETAGPSGNGRYPGALDSVAADLTRRGAGDYVVFDTKAGGEQRVAMMWDREWLRAKTEARDLFDAGTYKTKDGKDAFAQRTPLYGYFTARVPGDVDAGEARYGGGTDKFDFQALGVHLKAMKEGHDQRLRSAEVLVDWMTKTAPRTDNDVLIMGDWNAPPTMGAGSRSTMWRARRAWASLRFGGSMIRATFRICGSTIVDRSLFPVSTSLRSVWRRCSRFRGRPLRWSGGSRYRNFLGKLQTLPARKSSRS